MDDTPTIHAHDGRTKGMIWDKVNEVNIFELGAFLGLIAGTYFGACLGLQHSILWAVVGGVVGLPVGFFGGILAGLIFLMPFQLLAIMANKIKSMKGK